jgi:hypothetical protein
VLAVNLDQNRTKVIGLNSTGLWMIVPGGSSANVAAANLSFKEADALCVSEYVDILDDGVCEQ